MRTCEFTYVYVCVRERESESGSVRQGPPTPNAGRYHPPHTPNQAVRTHLPQVLYPRRAVPLKVRPKHILRPWLLLLLLPGRLPLLLPPLAVLPGRRRQLQRVAKGRGHVAELQPPDVGLEALRAKQDVEEHGGVDEGGVGHGGGLLAVLVVGGAELVVGEDCGSWGCGGKCG